jgi:hypothetical protein
MDAICAHFETNGVRDGREVERVVHISDEQGDVCAPVHLQWNGHCVTVVGTCMAIGNMCLFIIHGQTLAHTIALFAANSSSSVQRHLIVIDTANRDVQHLNRILWDVTKLNKREYQAVFVRGPPLTDGEREHMKSEFNLRRITT